MNFSFSAILWGGVASGIFIYGIKQRSPLALLGGGVMTVVTFFVESSLWLNVACLGIVAAMWYFRDHFD